MAADSIALVEHLFRRQAGQMVARLTRALGSRHLSLAEDAVQDALITALQQWPFRGVPDQPEAWLYLVARNRAFDRLRHSRMASEKEPALARDSAELAPRLDSVLESLYLIFNEGYAATSGDALVRDDVAGEAIRLASLVAAHPATGSPKAWALLALMLLHAARFPARVDSDGTLFLLREQDRGKWDREAIAAGMRALDRAAAGDRVSAFQIEAGIAACHAVAPSWEATDWHQIVELYDELLALTASPVVAMNRAIAISRLEGPLTGLAALDSMSGRAALAHYPLLPAVEAELWREAGELAKAAQCYRTALTRARSAPEQRWLSSRLTHLV